VINTAKIWQLLYFVVVICIPNSFIFDYRGGYDFLKSSHKARQLVFGINQEQRNIRIKILIALKKMS